VVLGGAVVGCSLGWRRGKGKGGAGAGAVKKKGIHGERRGGVRYLVGE